MESHTTHEAFIQMAKQLEQMSGHTECSSGPTPRSVSGCDLCERHTFADHKNKQ